eukprot:7577082-Pyramimonas_sp.AAC.1
MHCRMIRQMLGLRKAPDETVPDFQRRVNRRIPDAIDRHEVVTLDRFVLFQTHKWAGRAARMRRYGPTRVLPQTLAYK